MIESFVTFEEVGFYTIHDEDQAYSETDRFIARFFEEDSPTFEPGFEEACDQILRWIERIGCSGLRVIRTRKENEAEALPPKPGTIRELDLDEPPLRLYYVRLSDRVLVLCGGGKKASVTNQGSKGLMSHFRLANDVAKELATMIRSGEIWTDNTSLESDEEQITICLPS